MRAWISHLLALVVFALVLPPAQANPPLTGGEQAELARQAQAILKASCHRCHGQDGSLEGGMNYVLDRDKLITRKKIIPGQAEQSPLFKRIASGKMPPAGEMPRPAAAEVALLRRWIDGGAPAGSPTLARAAVTEAEVVEWIYADLQTIEKRARRFTRYFTLTTLANAGAGPDELQSYRNALAKLLNSLSWHPRITLPRPIDPRGLVLRIDLRDYQWDANLWNRLLAEYPYGILQDSGIGRAVMVATANRMPYVRLDWFVANASRAPLYYDLLQMPTNLAELERQLRVDVALDIQQERVARAGFLGSGISRNNRILERHDAQNGAYWRTYDFDAIPQNLTERDLLLPDRRNIFAYPLGPGLTDNTFQHAGGESIFNLPNGLHAYILINANNVRLDKGPIAIVSDPKRPDRAVEAGVSCMSCHAGGILQKADQIRGHVGKNPKAFSRADAGLIRALYVPEAKMKALMDEDTARFRKALARTGNTVGSVEVIMTLTLRYEADVDLPTLSAEAGLKPEELLPRLLKSDLLSRSLGALRVPGATVARQSVVQSFGDLGRELRLGSVLQPGQIGQTLPDNTGELDPLEAQSSPANALAFSPDGKLAAIAGADKTIRIFDIEAGRDLRRCIGHTASVWSVAFSPDGRQVLSGSKDGTVRLWEVETTRELRRLDGHSDLVTGVAFSPDGQRAVSVNIDGEAFLWDLEKGATIRGFAFTEEVRSLTTVSFSPDGKRLAVCSGKWILLLDARTGKVLRRLTGHTGWVTTAVFSVESDRLLSGSDDRTLRLWNVETGAMLKVFQGHEAGVKSVAFSPGGARLLSGGNDSTVRLWDALTGNEIRAFRKHTEPLVGVAFIDRGRQTLSGSRDAVIHPWSISRLGGEPEKIHAPRELTGTTFPQPPVMPIQGELRPAAIVPVGGTIGQMILSPDRRTLYYLNRTDGVLGRLNLTTRERARLVVGETTEAMSLSPDGKTLATIARMKEGTGPLGLLQLIDPARLQFRNRWGVPVVPYDVVAADNGLIYISGGAGEWTDIAAISGNKGEVVARWGGVWTRSFLQLSPDQKRLYHSTQGVSPGSVEALVLPAKRDEAPLTYKAQGRQPLGGEFQITPDGRFLLCKNGTVLRSSANRDSDLAFHLALKPFLAATVDLDFQGLFLLTLEGTLERYSYPDFKFQSSHKLGIVATQIISAGKEGLLIVAGFDPRTLGERPRARGHGDLFLYRVEDLAGRK